MQISDSLLRKKLENYVKSDKFQDKLAKDPALVKRITGSWEMPEIEVEIHRLKQMMLDAAIDLTRRQNGTSTSNLFGANSRLGGASPDGILSHNITHIQRWSKDPKIIQYCRVELFFNPDFVHANSLYPNGYPNGVDNLLRLLTNGWDYRRAQFDQIDERNTYHGGVFGTWHNIHPVYAISYRRPSSDLFHAIKKFNDYQTKEHGDVYAQLDSSYANVYGVYAPQGWTFETMPTGIGTIRVGIKI